MSCALCACVASLLDLLCEHVYTACSRRYACGGVRDVMSVEDESETFDNKPAIPPKWQASARGQLRAASVSQLRVPMQPAAAQLLAADQQFAEAQLRGAALALDDARPLASRAGRGPLPASRARSRRCCCRCRPCPQRPERPGGASLAR